MLWFQRISRCVATQLKREFGLSEECIGALGRHSHVFLRNKECAVGVIRLLKKWNLDVEQLNHYPSLIGIGPEMLDHRLHMLQECGLTVSLHALESFYTLSSGSIGVLRNYNLLSSTCDPLDELCGHMKLTHVEQFKSELIQDLGTSHVDSLTLDHMRAASLARYISWRMRCDYGCHDDDSVVTDSTHHQWMCCLSVRLVDASVALMLQAGYQPSQIMRNPLLLRAHPNSLSEYLGELQDRSEIPQAFDSLASMHYLTPADPQTNTCSKGRYRSGSHFPPNISTEMYVRRFLTFKPWYSMAVVSRVLKEFGLEADRYLIMDVLSLLDLPVLVLRKRLATLKKIEVVWCMRFERCFCHLVSDYHRVLARLALVACSQQVRHIASGEDNSLSHTPDTPATNVCYDNNANLVDLIEYNVEQLNAHLPGTLQLTCRDLMSSLYEFKRWLGGAHRRYSPCILRHFISCRLDVSLERVHEQLFGHPMLTRVALVQTAGAISWLLDEQDADGARFTHEQVYNALCVCLYPHHVLARYSNSAEYRQVAGQSTFPRHRLLQLLLYFIERDTHFDGTSAVDK